MPYFTNRGIIPLPVGGGAFAADGVDFNGSTEYNNATGFTGITSSSKTGTVSVWLNATGSGTPHVFAWQDTSAGGTFKAFLLRLNSAATGFAELKLKDSTGADIVSLATNSGLGSGSGIPPDSTTKTWFGSGWHWLAFSWDLASTVRHQSASNHYVTGGGLDQWDGSSWTDAFVAYPSGGTPYIGSSGGSGYFTGGMAELIFWAGVSLDLNDLTTRRKLITATGHPEDVGATGSLVTGSAPTFYFKGPAASFGTNAAGTGNITLNAGSAVTDSSTDP